MTKELVNTTIINGLKSKGIFIGSISPEVLNAFANIMYEALTIHSVVVPKGTLPKSYCPVCKQDPCERLGWSHPLEDDDD